MAVQKFIAINDNTQVLTETLPTTVGGVGAAEKIVALNTAGRLDVSMMPTGIAPEVKTGTAYEAIAANALVYIRADGQIANAIGAAGGNYAKGWSAEAVALGNPVTVQFESTITGLTGLVPNTTYFLSDSIAGGITATAPSATGTLWQEVGVAISATELNFTNAGTRIKRA